MEVEFVAVECEDEWEDAFVCGRCGEWFFNFETFTYEDGALCPECAAALSSQVTE